MFSKCISIIRTFYSHAKVGHFSPFVMLISFPQRGCCSWIVSPPQNGFDLSSTCHRQLPRLLGDKWNHGFLKRSICCSENYIARVRKPEYYPQKLCGVCLSFFSDLHFLLCNGRDWLTGCLDWPHLLWSCVLTGFPDQHWPVVAVGQEFLKCRCQANFHKHCLDYIQSVCFGILQSHL